jgi:hypothetical protein
MRHPVLLPALLALALSACNLRVGDDADADRGAEASSGSTGGGWDEGERQAPPTAKGEAAGTSVAISADRASGGVKIALPGARFDIDLPASMFKAGELDIDGNKLYPGSVVDTFDVRGKAGPEEDAVRIAFTSPAAPDVVKGWLVGQAQRNGRPLRQSAEALVGTTREGKLFTIRLAPGASAGETKGVILILS